MAKSSWKGKIEEVKKKINKITFLLTKKIKDLQKEDDLCKYNKAFEYLGDKDSESICKNERLNNRIPRHHMPQIINGKLFLSDQVFIDSMINFITSYEGNLDRSSVEEEILKENPGLKTINENNYVEIYIALINLYRNEGEEKLRYYISKLNGRSIEDIVNEESNFGTSLQPFNINKIRPSQKDILSSKTAGIAAYILVKSLDGTKIKNQEIEDDKLDEVIKYKDKIMNAFFGKHVSYLTKMINLRQNLKENVNEFCRGISVDLNGQIIDGHHRWSGCMLVKYIVDSVFLPESFVNEIELNMKTIKGSAIGVFFKTYYNKVFEHPLVFSLDLDDKFVVKPDETTRVSYFRSLEGGKRKTKRRRKRSKRTRKRVRKTKKSRRRVKIKY